MIDSAVKAHLAADPTLAAMLGTYQGAPAIFVDNTIPAQFDREAAGNVDKAYVALQDGDRGPYLDGENDFFTQPVEVLALAVDQGDASHVDQTADRIRTLLAGAAIAPDGYDPAGAYVDSGPVPDNPDDLTFGRRLIVVVGLIETS